MKVKGFAVMCLTALLITTTLASAASSDISFKGATTVSEADGSSAVAIDGEAIYLASGYDDHMTVMWLDNLTVLTTVELNRPVQTLEFSPDGAMLAIAVTGSETETDSIQLFDMDSMTMTAKQQAANPRPTNIEWSPDGGLLAVPNSNNGVDLIRVSDMEVERSLSNEHNTDVTCISFSQNGAHLLTGDGSGRMVMWNVDGTATAKKWELNHEVISCEFDSSETRIASMTIAGNVNTMSFAGGALQDAKFEAGGKMSWSNDGSHLHLIVPGSAPRVVTIDASTFDVLATTNMAHQVLDMAFVENQFGMVERLYVATNTLHLAVYGQHQLQDGYGEAGADLDGDGVPDTLDSDDDGDAISDEWDTYCTLDDVECSRSPDPEHIRTLTVNMNESHIVIVDRIKLDIVLSSMIRNMSRTSVIQDTQLSKSETALFAESVCVNLKQERMIEQWRGTLILSEGQLVGGSVECRVSEGMTLTAQNDYKTLIGFEFVITFNLSSPPAYPLVVTFDDQPGASDASLAHLAEMHPIHVDLSSKGAHSVQWSPWWTTESPLELTLQEKKTTPLTLSEKGVDLFANYPILWLPIFALLGVGILGVLRAKNTLGLDLNIFDEDEDEVHTKKEQVAEKEVAEPEGEAEELELEHSTNENTVPTGNSPPSRRKGGDATPTEDDPSTENQRRKRSVAAKREGPITSVKRQRLDQLDQKSPAKKRTVSKKKVVTKEAPKRKTRRVVTHSDIPDEDSPGES